MPSHDGDICAGRHRGNRVSESAFEGLKPGLTDLCRRVLEYAQNCGAQGVTSGDVEYALMIGYTTASARLSQLKAEGLLFDSGRRRASNGHGPAAVLVIKRHRPVLGDPVAQEHFRLEA